MFAVGVGIGSIACARCCTARSTPRLVPFAALGISMFCWDFASAAAALGAAASTPCSPDHPPRPPGASFGDLALLAMCGGVFSVPLYAIIQENSAPPSASK